MKKYKIKNLEELISSVKDKFSIQLNKYNQYLNDYGQLRLYNKDYPGVIVKLVICDKCKKEGMDSRIWVNSGENKFNYLIENNLEESIGEYSLSFLNTILNDDNTICWIFDHGYSERVFFLIDNNKLDKDYQQYIEKDYDERITDKYNTVNKLSDTCNSLRSEIAELKAKRDKYNDFMRNFLQIVFQVEGTLKSYISLKDEKIKEGLKKLYSYEDYKKFGIIEDDDDE